MKTLIFALLVTVGLCADSNRFREESDIGEPFTGGLENERYSGGTSRQPFPGGMNRESFPGGMDREPFPGGMGREPFPGGIEDSYPGGMGKRPLSGGIGKETSPGVAGKGYGRPGSPEYFPNKEGIGNYGNGGLDRPNSMFGNVQYYTSMGVLPVPGSGLCTCPQDMYQGNSGRYPGGGMMGGNMMGVDPMYNRPGRYPNGRNRYDENGGIPSRDQNTPFLGSRGNFEDNEDKKNGAAAGVPEKASETKSDEETDEQHL